MASMGWMTIAPLIIDPCFDADTHGLQVHLGRGQGAEWQLAESSFGWLDAANHCVETI